jgi:hypothetical protein
MGAFGWVCFFSTLMTSARRLAGARALRVADLAGGLMLLGFAGLALWRAIADLV